MPEVSTTAHRHIGHASKTPNPEHRTKYKASQTKVTAEGTDKYVIRAGDATACGDPVVGVSSKVFVGGKGVHRKGDATGGHTTWPANASSEGSSKVDAGG
jgi:uncharacterized Zn-binding protein involved in type VI secretion